jgi:hypothetical protein
MKKYAVGDVVMVPVTIVEVHEQGFKYGLHANGAPNMPPHANPTAAELEDARKELPDTLIASTPEGVEFDSHGRAHFNAALAL